MSNDANTLKKRQEIKKYLVYAGMFLLFIGCMWWIFAPSKEDRQEETKKAGFNTELPDPRGAGIEGDKIAAYEQADMRRRQEEKIDPVRSKFGKIEKEEVPLPDKLLYVETYARTHKKFSFRMLLEKQRSKMHIVVTFLAVLELMKTGMIRVYQEEICGEILEICGK